MTTNPPLWQDTLTVNGQQLRRADALMVMSSGSALGARSGIMPGSGGLTCTVAGTTISVSAGAAVVYQSGQGVYRVVLTSAWSGTLAAADATYTRIDLVYLRVWDTDVDASGLRQGDIVYLAGTPSATPSAPTPSGTVIYMPLATITVPPTGGGSASVSTSIRPYTVAPGGILPVTSTTEPTSGGPGQAYYDTDTDCHYYFKADGTTKVPLANSGARTVWARKTSDQSVTNSVAIVADTQLQLPVAANATYELSGLLLYSAIHGGNLRPSWTGPSGATLDWAARGLNTNDTGLLTATGENVTANTIGSLYYPVGGPDTGGNSSIATLIVQGLLITSSTPGSLVYAWSQYTANATATIMRTGSYLVLRRLA